MPKAWRLTRTFRLQLSHLAAGQLAPPGVNALETPAQQRADFPVGLGGKQVRVTVARLAFHVNRLRWLAGGPQPKVFAAVPHAGHCAVQSFRHFTIGVLAQQRILGLGPRELPGRPGAAGARALLRACGRRAGIFHTRIHGVLITFPSSILSSIFHPPSSTLHPLWLRFAAKRLT
jgi:hypothetical protein